MVRPIVFTASWLSQALPVVAYAMAPRRSRAAGLVVFGSLASVFATSIGEILRVTHGNNLIVSYLSSPLTAACYIWALREWLIGPRERLVFWWGAVTFLLVWLALVTWVEDVTSWDTYTFSLYALVILVPAIWTLVRRGTIQEGVRFDRSEWFWVTVGLGLHGAINAIAAPVGSLLVARHEIDTWFLVWKTRATLNVCAFLMVTWGIRNGPPGER